MRKERGLQEEGEWGRGAGDGSEREGRRKKKMGGCGRKEGRCPAGSSKEVVVGGGSRHMGAVEKINRSEEKSRSTVESASRTRSPSCLIREAFFILSSTLVT